MSRARSTSRVAHKSLCFDAGDGKAEECEEHVRMYLQPVVSGCNSQNLVVCCNMRQNDCQVAITSENAYRSDKAPNLHNFAGEFAMRTFQLCQAFGLVCW